MQSTQRVAPEIIDQVSLRLDQFIIPPLRRGKGKNYRSKSIFFITFTHLILFTLKSKPKPFERCKPIEIL